MRAAAITARILLAVASVAASVAFWTLSAQRTILDPDATRDLATRLLETEHVSESLVATLLDQILPQVPAGFSEADVRRIAEIALHDPGVAAAFGVTIGELHEQLLAGNRVDAVAVDTTVVNRALRDAVADLDPELATQLDGYEPVDLTIDTTALPSLRPIDRRAAPVLLGAALAAVAGFGLAVALHPEPWTGVGAVGRRLVVVAVVPVVLYLAIPAALRTLRSGWAATAVPFASAYGRRILPAAVALLVTGAGLWLTGTTTAKEARR